MGHGSPRRLRHVVCTTAVAVLALAPAARAGDLSAVVAPPVTAAPAPSATDSEAVAASAAASTAAITAGGTGALTQTSAGAVADTGVSPPSATPSALSTAATSTKQEVVPRATELSRPLARAVGATVHAAVGVSRLPDPLSAGAAQPRAASGGGPDQSVRGAKASAARPRPEAQAPETAARHRLGTPQGPALRVSRFGNIVLARSVAATSGGAHGRAVGGGGAPFPESPARSPGGSVGALVGAAASGAGPGPLVAIGLSLLVLLVPLLGGRLMPAHHSPHGYLPILLLERPD